MSTTTQKLKSINAEVAALGNKINKLEKQRELLTRQERLEKAQKAGVVIGKHYKAIPVTRSGDVLVGKVLKIDTNHWRSNVQVVMLVPAKGRFMERTVYISLDDYEFESVKPQRKSSS